MNEKPDSRALIVYNHEKVLQDKQLSGTGETVTTEIDTKYYSGLCSGNTEAVFVSESETDAVSAERNYEISSSSEKILEIEVCTFLCVTYTIF